MTDALIHKELSGDRWQTLPLAEQIGNIGSELSRAQSWHEKGLLESKNQALVRALELIDMTLDHLHTPSRLKEIARLREAVAGLFVGGVEQYASFADLETFYMPWALLARR